jgi:hypothetical protein
VSRVDVLAVMDASALILWIEGQWPVAPDAEALGRARIAVAEVFAAAHASLTARDLADQVAADDRLRAALAACQPTETDHNREDVDGLCVEESDNAR